MQALCRYDFVTAINDFTDAKTLINNDTPDINIYDIKEEMISSIKGSPIGSLAEERFITFIDKVFDSTSYEITNFERLNDTYVYYITFKMPDFNALSDMSDVTNDNTLKDVLTECLEKGILTEQDLYSSNVSTRKEQQFMEIAVDKIIELLYKKLDTNILSARIKLVVYQNNNGEWLIERSSSNMNEFFSIFN